MPCTLLVMRHGKSAWDEPGVADHDRNLTKRGKGDAHRIGEALARQGLVPQCIMTSTAKRARATARRVAKELDAKDVVEQHALLYDSDAWTQLGLIASLGAEIDCAMVVGHNPSSEDLVALLTGRKVLLKTANVAWIELPIDDWGELLQARRRGRLRGLLQPKLLTV